MSSPSKPVAILGASGLVGSALAEDWSPRYDLITPSHGELDVLDPTALRSFVADTPAVAIVNAVAWADVDGAEAQKDEVDGLAHRLNVGFARQLAHLCREHSRYLLHISTDYVFDGTKSEAAYVEEDSPRALCWYAETKLRGELAVRAEDPSACIARIEMPFTAHVHPKSDLARTFATRLRERLPIHGVTDQRITPLFLKDGVAALRMLIEARHAGVIHIAASDSTTPFDFAQGIASRLGLSAEGIHSTTFEQFSRTRPALRPQHSWLDVSHFTDLYGRGILRPVQDELDRWVAQCPSK
jgi:dTDP-4-dehydrorhamnose reductase